MVHIFFHSCKKHLRAPSLQALEGSRYRMEGKTNVAPIISKLRAAGKDKLIILENVLRRVGWDFSGAESRNIKPRLGVSGNGPWGWGQGVERAQHSRRTVK